MKFRVARLGTTVATIATVTAMSMAGPTRADEALIARGEYLAHIMDCTGCHTPGSMSGNPDMARYLGGGDMGFEIPGLGIFWPSNLTSDEATGIGSWTVDDIVTAVRTGETPDGRILAPIMPVASYGKLNDDDAIALATFIKSLPAVSNAVPDPVASAGEAKLPYFTVVVPSP